MQELSDEDKNEVYVWVDTFSLSRPKKNIWRDFSDGVLAAEVIYQVHPQLVNLNNYTPSSNISQKLLNWQLLNNRALRKLNMSLPQKVIDQIVHSRPGVIEQVLFKFKQNLANIKPTHIPVQSDLEDTIKILQIKIQKLQQLLELKDAKIQQLSRRR